ncbi:hypothetical protein [Streptomyces sp. WAC 06738]|uniref:hypothetical protein n=1 Tax=Streptomyces sp. WAC 06738 TaxID=2203210 RepID=UPI001F0C0134|nr:hypothetical protein [Streptomyces sp. WAC 06738]
MAHVPAPYEVSTDPVRLDRVLVRRVPLATGDAHEVQDPGKARLRAAGAEPALWMALGRA